MVCCLQSKLAKGLNFDLFQPTEFHYKHPILLRTKPWRISTIAMKFLGVRRNYSFVGPIEFSNKSVLIIICKYDLCSQKNTIITVNIDYYLSVYWLLGKLFSQQTIVFRSLTVSVTAHRGNGNCACYLLCNYTLKHVISIFSDTLWKCN